MQSVLIFIRLSEKKSACEQTSRATFEPSGAVPMVKVLTCTFAANKELETWSSAILDHILKRFLLCPMWLNTDTSETLGLRQRLKDWMGDDERWWGMEKHQKELGPKFLFGTGFVSQLRVLWGQRWDCLRFWGSHLTHVMVSQLPIESVGFSIFLRVLLARFRHSQPIPVPEQRKYQAIQCFSSWFLMILMFLFCRRVGACTSCMYTTCNIVISLDRNSYVQKGPLVANSLPCKELIGTAGCTEGFDKVCKDIANHDPNYFVAVVVKKVFEGQCFVPFVTGPVPDSNSVFEW